MNAAKSGNSILQSVSDSIVPFDREKDLQLEIATKVIKLLQRWSQYRPSKTQIAGSIGKKTTIVSSDVDLIVFLNSQGVTGKSLDNFLSNALEDYKSVLESRKPQIPIRDVQVTVFSLKFTVRNIKFDLLPAIDFVGNEVDALATIRRQQQATLDVMTQNLERNVYRFSSSLAFSTVEFMKKQSSFAHDMARLAKFWYKSARIEDHVSGAGYFMELVAVHVVNQMNSQSHREAFLKFLTQMENFNAINIVFPDEYDHLKNHRVQAGIRLPRLMDPTNPYNNLGKHFGNKLHVMNALKAHARQTRLNLEELISSPQLELYHSINVFDPNLFGGIKIFNVSQKYNEKGIRRLKDVDIRSKATIGVRKKIEFIQLCMSAVVNKLEERYGHGKLELLIEAFVQILTEKLKVKTSLAVHSKYAHKDFDASVWLKTKHSGAIRFSFDVEGTGATGEKVKAKKQIYSRRTRAQLQSNATALHCFLAYVV